MRLVLQPPEFALAGLCVVLASLVLYECLAPLPPFDPAALQLPRRNTIAPIASYAPPPAATFSVIDARPLFNPTRQPVVATPVPGSSASSAPPPPPDVVLIGVILDGDRQLALLKAPGAPFATSFKIGATVDVWQVAEITPDHVVLRAGAAEQILRMTDKRQTQPSPPPAFGTQPPPAQSGQTVFGPPQRQNVPTRDQPPPTQSDSGPP